jgi:hypothetical protein
MQLEGVQTPQLAVEKRGPREIQVGKAARYEIVVRNVGNATVRVHAPCSRPVHRFPFTHAHLLDALAACHSSQFNIMRRLASHALQGSSGF